VVIKSLESRFLDDNPAEPPQGNGSGAKDLTKSLDREQSVSVASQTARIQKDVP
jgi:hypothetical protein